MGGVTIRDGQAQFDGKAGERVELLAGGPDGTATSILSRAVTVTVEAWYTVKSADEMWRRVFDFGTASALGESGSVGGKISAVCSDHHPRGFARRDEQLRAG